MTDALACLGPVACMTSEPLNPQPHISLGRAWSIGEGRCLQIYSGHLHSVTSICVDRNGVMLSGGGDVRVWSIGTGQVLQVLEWQQRVDCLALLPPRQSTSEAGESLVPGCRSQRQGGHEVEAICALSGRIKGISCQGYLRKARHTGAVVLPVVFVQAAVGTSVVPNA